MMKKEMKGKYDEAIRKYLAERGVDRIDIKAALIDMDGVLYDSMRNHTIAWKMLFDSLGLNTDRDEFYMYEGMTGRATIQLIFKRELGVDMTDEDAREMYKIKTANFRSLPRVEAMPGAYDMLSALSLKGVERVLVTGSGQADVINRIDQDYAGLFAADKRITAADVTHGKPNPEPYIKGQQLAGVAPEQAIVIENAPLGVQAGNASGSFTIAITTGPIPRQAFVDSGAHLVFESMPQFAAELPQLIDSLNNVTL
ncbi:MAG: HAD family hydrolase [Muribaculaceae bacterium]